MMQGKQSYLENLLYTQRLLLQSREAIDPVGKHMVLVCEVLHGNEEHRLKQQVPRGNNAPESKGVNTSESTNA